MNDSAGRTWIGISGYDYPGWKGLYYPATLARTGWFAYVSRRFDSVELNGTFYSLKSPDVYRRWAEQSPDGFVLAVKGSRFITHNLKLRRAEQALANFYASGVLALGRKTGPFLWQLPDTYRFSGERIEEFLPLLPGGAAAGAALASRHDHRLAGRALVAAEEDVPYRHAVEVRHESYFNEAFYTLLRAHGIGLVIADTAGRWQEATAVTAPFVYLRLHGSRELYASAYTDTELDTWAARIVGWMHGRPPRDVYAYFDNDARGHAPLDARRLRERVDRLVASPLLLPT